jgi:hypothetical protein
VPTLSRRQDQPARWRVRQPSTPGGGSEVTTGAPNRDGGLALDRPKLSNHI